MQFLKLQNLELVFCYGDFSSLLNLFDVNCFERSSVDKHFCQQSDGSGGDLHLSRLGKDEDVVGVLELKLSTCYIGLWVEDDEIVKFLHLGHLIV